MSCSGCMAFSENVYLKGIKVNFFFLINISTDDRLVNLSFKMKYDYINNKIECPHPLYEIILDYNFVFFSNYVRGLPGWFFFFLLLVQLALLASEEMNANDNFSNRAVTVFNLYNLVFLQALICSSFVPIYCGLIPPSFRGVVSLC